MYVIRCNPYTMDILLVVVSSTTDVSAERLLNVIGYGISNVAQSTGAYVCMYNFFLYMQRNHTCIPTRRADVRHLFLGVAIISDSGEVLHMRFVSDVRLPTN